ncbi:MAG: hypothetical protein COA79_06360 [Planctomycetota bacterium]|nr:MAG: hypothetical protein COA79_06360 [Planctomycetota bacterium]
MKTKILLEKILSESNNVEMVLCKHHIRNESFHNLPESLDCHLLTYVEKGFLEMKIDSKSYRVEEGQIIWISPTSIRQYYKSDDKNESRFFNLRILIPEFKSHFKQVLLFNKNYLAFKNYFSQWHDFDLHSHPYLKSIFKGIWLQFLSEYIMFNYEETEEEKTFDFQKRKVIQEYITINIHKNIDISELANQVNLSLDYFSRLFKNTYKQAPRYYLKKIKMERAGEIIKETTLNINQIASMLNMTNFSLFCKQFKDIYGLSPEAYRKSNRF